MQGKLTMNSNSICQFATLSGILLHNHPVWLGRSCVSRTCLFVFHSCQRTISGLRKMYDNGIRAKVPPDESASFSLPAHRAQLTSGSAGRCRHMEETGYASA